MMVKTAEKYKSMMKAGKLPYVESSYNKDEEYFLSRCQHYFGLYASDMTNVGYGGNYLDGPSRRTFKELRDHARGLQNPDKYKDQLDPARRNKRGNYVRRWKISWDPIRTVPKFRSIIKSKFLENKIIPTTVAIDDTAKVEKQMQKNRLRLLKNPSTKAFIQNTAYSPDETSQEAAMQTPEDVDFVFEMGGIRLEAEIQMKDALDFVMRNSSYDDVLAEMLIEDVIDLNACAVDEEIIDGRPEKKYVDFASCFARPSKYPDFRDSDFRGYIERLPVIQILREAAADLRPEQIEELRKLSQAYGSHHGSQPMRSNDRGLREDYTNRSGILVDASNDYGLEVMTIYFIDTQVERYVEGRHPRGSRIFERVDENFTLSERGKAAGKELNEYDVLNLYKCRWVVGTEIVYGYGIVDVAFDPNKPGYKKVCWPLTMHMGQEPSLIERIVGFDDDMQIANFKLRNLFAKVPPGPRMVLFKNLIRDRTTIAGEEYTILDIINNYQSEGVFILDKADSYLLPEEERSTKEDPIRFIPSGITEDATILKQEIFDKLDMIRQATGIHEVVDGSSQKGDMLKGVMEALQQASNNALAPFMRLYQSFYKDMARYTVFRFLHNLAMGPIELGALSFGNSDFKLVRLGNDVKKYDWGIDIEIVSMAHKIQLQQELSARKDMLSVDHYFLVWNMIQQDDLKKAQYFLAKFVSQAKKEQFEQQKQIAQATSQGNAQAAIATEKARAQTIQVQTEADMKLAAQKAELDERFAQSNHRREMDQIKEKNALDKEKELAIVRANNANRLDQ